MPTIIIWFALRRLLGATGFRNSTRKSLNYKFDSIERQLHFREVRMTTKRF